MEYCILNTGELIYNIYYEVSCHLSFLFLLTYSIATSKITNLGTTTHMMSCARYSLLCGVRYRYRFNTDLQYHANLKIPNISLLKKKKRRSNSAVK